MKTDQNDAGTVTAQKTVVDDAKANARNFLQGIAGKMVEDSYGDSRIEPAPPKEAPAEAEQTQDSVNPESGSDDLSQPELLEGVTVEEGTEPQGEEETSETGDTQEQDDDQTEGGKPKLDPELQAQIDKRIAKEVAKTKAAEERLEEMAQQLSQLKNRMDGNDSPVKQASVAENVSKIESIEDLGTLETQAEQAVDQTEELMDRLEDSPEFVENQLKELGVKSTDSNGSEDWSPESMKRALRAIQKNASRTLKAIPKRMSFLEKQAQAQEQIARIMPELKDPQSERFKRFEAAMKSVPQIRTHPQWPALLGVFVMGAEALARQQAKANATAQAKPKVQTPPSVPSGAPAPGTLKSQDQRANDSGLSKRVFDPNFQDREARVNFIQKMLEKSEKG